MDTGLIILRVIQFTGEHPIVKFRLAETEYNGHAFKDVTVTVFDVLHPFAKSVVCKV